MAFGGISAVMDQLVAGARATRDNAFNTLDAVQRRTKTFSDDLAARAAERVEELRASTQSRDAQRGPVRDDRFDPEDEWEVSGPAPAAGATGAGGQSAAGAAPHSPRSQREEEDDYPDTWLR